MSSELSDYLVEQLRMRDWSQKDLADRSGVALSSISRIITDDLDKPPGFAIIVSVAQAMRVDPVVLLRKSGLLPREPESTSLERQLLAAFRQLPSEHQRSAVLFVEYLFTQRNNLVPFPDYGQK